MNEGVNKRKKEERDKSTRGKWKRLEKDSVLRYKEERGIYTSIQKGRRRG